MRNITIMHYNDMKCFTNLLLYFKFSYRNYISNLAIDITQSDSKSSKCDLYKSRKRRVFILDKFKLNNRHN